MNKPLSSPSYTIRLAGLAMGLMAAASCSSDDVTLAGSQSADAHQRSADGSVGRADASDTQQRHDTERQKITPVTVSCQAVQKKLNAVFEQIDAQCPVNDTEIEGLDSELIARAMKIIQNFQLALGGKNVTMKRYNQASTDGALFLADENGKLDTKYTISVHEGENEFVLNIGNTDLQIIFTKYKDSEGKEKMLLREIRLAEEQDVCKPATNPYSVLTLELSEQGPAYGHLITAGYNWETYSDVFPEQGTFICKVKSQAVDCPTSTINPWLSTKVAYKCNPLGVNIEKGKVITPENGFALAQQVLSAAKPLVTKIMTTYSKNDSWKKIAWKVGE